MQDNKFSKYPEKVVNIENPVFKSFQGKYFLGQSNLMTFGYDGYALGTLYNPPNSGVTLYFSVFTVTNTSDIPIKARIYVNANIPEGVFYVTSVAPSNLTISPAPVPKVQFLAGQFIQSEITGGVKVFTRMAPANTTLAIEKNGKIIIPEGGNITLSLVPPENQLVKADVAAGWWEEKM